ncbi:MAG: hypothetical protein FIA95_03875 [Gemmatimonadetes bacterium]|nr:hypothetical protein [Gemmatimonadota bacterium]
MKSRPKILGQLLVEAGCLEPAALDEVLAAQPESGLRLGELLSKRGEVPAEAVARALAVQLGLPYAPPPLDPEPAALALVRPELARARRVVPLRASARTLVVAMADPLDLGAVDDLQFQSGRRVEAHVATEPAVLDALERCYGGTLEGLVASLPSELRRTPEAANTALERAIRSAPVVRLVDRILLEAVEAGVSDIHVEEPGGDARVRYRVDGVLRRALEIPAAARNAVLSRNKVMAGMDICL